MKPQRARSSQGLTLVEILLAIILMGILSGILAGGMGGLVPAGRQEAAISKARILNAARCSFALLDPAAETLWAAAGSDQARLNLLCEARVLEGASQGMLASSGSYTLSLAGALRDPTLLLREGVAVDYLTP